MCLYYGQRGYVRIDAMNTLLFYFLLPILFKGFMSFLVDNSNIFRHQGKGRDCVREAGEYQVITLLLE